MLAILVCLFLGLATFFAGRKSLVHGLLAMLGTGYIYGITRANILSPFSHFIFDASLGGLYLSQLFAKTSPEVSARGQKVRLWLIGLIGWPLLVSLLPFQTFLISMVGLRGNVFFLPLMALASRLSNIEWHRLAAGLAWLNLFALVFGTAEYFLGIERFYPWSPVTAIIYGSKDVAGFEFYRIPGTFANAHSYAGQMVYTLPLLIGAWAQAGLSKKRRMLLLAGIAAAAIGVLMANTRLHAVGAAVIGLGTLFLIKLTPGRKALWAALLAGVVALGLLNGRFQRFTTLGDSEAVSERIRGSVNRSFLEVLVESPMGNGMGGGGTSIPTFLEGDVKKPVSIESEYARILLEQGVIGLLIWVAFLVRLLSLRSPWQQSHWMVGRRLAWLSCVVSLMVNFIGIGMMTAIPQSGILIMYFGWLLSVEETQTASPARAPRKAPAAFAGAPATGGI